MLHTKAGLLRAGANILAQKANALDRFAQAIPGLNSNIINSMGGGGGGGYGAPPSNTYGAPPPSNTYGAPPPSNGYGAPQGPLISGPNQARNNNLIFLKQVYVKQRIQFLSCQNKM